MAIIAKLSGAQSLSATFEEKQPVQASMRGPLGGGSDIRLVVVTILASAWVGTESPYSQVVTINGVTKYSKVDLQPSVEQLEIFHDKDLAFVTENDDGVVTVFAIGDKPTSDYTIQATIMEVSA